MKNCILITCILLCTFFAKKVSATHIFGGEIDYTYVSGNTYNLRLIIYADCAGSSTLITNLYSATPVILVYNNTTLTTSLNLSLLPGSGIDVSPVCPSQINSTYCTNGTLPGVRQFIYTGQYTLPSASSMWRFYFNADLNISNNQTGRSSNITNIIQTNPTTKLTLEATLNNLTAPNSSPTYTTIPTPFFCINVAQNYNQGAVDPDLDILSYTLVNAIDVGNPPTYSPIAYLFPYTFADPLAYTPGTFSFSATTGQLAFTPNVVQNSLVVSKVTETRNGVVVGTSMREMTFVVLPNCTNVPPVSVIGAVSGATSISPTVVTACQNSSAIGLTLNPTDANGNNITVTSSGLPAGASATVTSNGTSSPTVNFNWPAGTGFTIGTYIFYLNLQDDGCPLANNQTIAFTINIVPVPSVTAVVVSATCANGNVGSITATGANGVGPYTYSTGGAFQSSGSFPNMAPAAYIVTVKDANGCTGSTNATINQQIGAILTSVTKTNATCFPGCDANITATSTGGLSPITYSIGGAFQSSGVFNNVCIGTYTVTVIDGNLCTSTSVVTVTNPVTPTITAVTETDASCAPGCDATISNINVTPAAVYTYSLNGGPFQASSTFNNLCVGSYTIIAKDANQCTASSIVIISNPNPPSITSVSTDFASCVPGCDGGIAGITVSGTAPPYTFSLNGSAFQNSQLFPNKCIGTYTLVVKDAVGCTSMSAVTIATQPSPNIVTISNTTASCVPGCDAVSTITATSPVLSPLMYKANTTAYQNSNVINNLCPGVYTITVVDNKGCTSSSTTTVLKSPNPTIDNSNAINITCYGKNDGIINMAVTGVGAINYLLLPSNILNTTGNFTGLSQGNYSIVATDSKGCTVSNAFVIIEPAILAWQSVTKRDKTCKSQNNGWIEAKPMGGTQPYSFVMQPGSLNSTTGSYTNLDAGTYSITLTDASGCSINTTVIILPPVNPLEITSDFESIKCTGTFNSGWAEIYPFNGMPPYSFVWNTIPPQYTARATELFGGTFIGVASDANGCSESDTVTLVDPSYCCDKIFIPNAFTPNGDGINDAVNAITETNIEFRDFSVFNRWGERVFFTTNISDKWNGSLRGKDNFELGVYFYLIRYKCLINNNDYTKKGDIILIP
jgi:gliding motility-associated-like protein